MKPKSNSLLESFYLTFLLITTLILRFVNLSYSHFQGDEIKVLFTSGASFFDFIMTQRKGPVQYIVTYLVSLLSKTQDELILRIPFAIAGTLSVFVLYFLVKELYGRKVAGVASFLFSVNGLFVAFSRIVQYQSFNYLFYLLALYFFVFLNKYRQVKDLYFGCFFLALGILTHYDAVFVILPSAYFVFLWLKKSKGASVKKHIIAAILLLVVFISLFYVPFFLHPSFSSNTKAYLFTRISGESSKISSSYIIYKLYNPLLSYSVLIVFGVIGAVFGGLSLIPMYLWFLIPFLLLNLVASLPGTHIYTYFIPLIIVSSQGIVRLNRVLRIKFIQYIYQFSVVAVLLFFSYQSYVLFVDHKVEYPWNIKKVLYAKVALPDKNKFNLSIFGFPYNRKFDEVNQFIQSRNDISRVFSNENAKIIGYYIKPLPVVSPTYTAYIYVYGAQSLLITKSAKTANLGPEAAFYKGENKLVKVYLIPNALEQPQ